MITFNFYFLVTRDYRFLRKDGTLTYDITDENIFYGSIYHIYKSGLYGDGAVEEFLRKSGLVPKSKEKLFIGYFDYATMFKKDYYPLTSKLNNKALDVKKMNFIFPDESRSK